MGKPKVSTAKKLFALTGNRCAFPNCPNHLVDVKSNGAIARICHIKGNREGSARHDKEQSEQDRQSLANLVAMCAIHSDIIDNPEMVRTYTVEWLLDVKAKHEAQFTGQIPDDELSDEFADGALTVLIQDTLVLSANQSGGQTAGTILNLNVPTAQVEDAFKSELHSRNLSQPSSADFGKTVYRKHHVLVDVGSNSQPLPSAAVFFARLPSQIVSWGEKKQLLDWMDPNARRYEPLPHDYFIPTLSPDAQGRGFVWSDAEKHRFGRSAYMRYLAVETSGYIEYGIYPGSVGDDEPIVYYAKIIAHGVAFLHFLRDIASRFGVNIDGAGIGLALCGTDGKYLRGINDWHRNSSHFKTSADDRSLLYVHEPSNSPWTTEDVALDLAGAVLSHWGFPTPAHGPTPEFENQKYAGPFFKRWFQRFQN